MPGWWGGNGSDRGSALVGFDWSVGCVPGSSQLQPSELPGVTGAAVAGQGFLLLRKMVGLRVMIFIPGDCREKSIGDASEWVRTRLEDRDFIMTAGRHRLSWASRGIKYQISILGRTLLLPDQVLQSYCLVHSLKEVDERIARRRQDSDGDKLPGIPLCGPPVLISVVFHPQTYVPWDKCLKRVYWEESLEGQPALPSSSGYWVPSTE
ncbi:hypothetical protein BO99DRAFT_125682 [Aspergillus violaceofuscus CBS 115571]|uniref:Uncharacterized protein n=1 Tax=Aspergillus violaceofuscus (strain CBS 115571) TaxID=1450538 RepID=A0A2V5HR54_ASPV1|nr:hypothetical protein BO99DRAFT_125682 [Aspergillus violaceofuscus CBS 115571]